MCLPEDDLRTKEEHLRTAPAKSPRDAIEMAMALNSMLGHENNGCLSFSHGFAPMLTPPASLPPAFKAWDDLGRMLPQLWSSGRIRSYVDNELPTLNADDLPHEYSLRAAHILGIVLHAYWHVGGIRAPDGGEELVPPTLQRPWYKIVMEHLKRDQPYMGFFEMLMVAFNYKEMIDDITPRPENRVPWATEEAAKNGRREYNPTGVTVETFQQVVSLSGKPSEKYFFGVFAEMNCRCGQLVRHMVEAQEAAVELKKLGYTNGTASETAISQPKARLRESLLAMRELIESYTDSFLKIHSIEASSQYVDPTVWAEAIAPVDKPFPGVKVGPSGAGMPLGITLDAFFRRSEHGNYIGKQILEQQGFLPPNWNRFIQSMRDADGVGPIVAAGNDSELKGIFAGALGAYAGEHGFLGKHRLKIYGFMEITKKLARSKVLNYTGLLKDRIWVKIAKFMREAQKERFAVPLDAESSLCSVAHILPTPQESNGEKGNSCLHVRVDISGTGIAYSPGDRVGILYEADESLVQETILALAGGDKNLTAELSETPVALNGAWREALRVRSEYHACLDAKKDDTVLPQELPLYQFLRYAQLRPVHHETLRLGYACTFDPLLRQFLEKGQETMLQAPDVIKLLKRSHSNALKLLLRSAGSDGSNVDLLEENIDKLFGNADLDNAGYISRNSLVASISPLFGNDSEQSAIGNLLDAFDADKSGKIGFEKFKEFLMTSIQDGALASLFLPSMSDLLPPAGFRMYSVASSNKAEHGEMHLCVGEVNYSQPDPTAEVSPLFVESLPKLERSGVASKFLRDRTVGSKPEKVVIQHYRQPTFRLPRNSEAPVIMFAAGSGVAPFRSFWQELAVMHKRAVSAGTPKPPKALLVLQVRTRASVPFAGELASLVKDGVMDVEIFLSREDFHPCFTDGLSWNPAERGYAHDALLKEGKLRDRVTKGLGSDGISHAYICSGAGFATNIMNTISKIMGEDQVESMLASHRLCLEVFTSLRGPDPTLPEIPMSQLMFSNDFNGREGKQNSPLHMAIDGLIYDMGAFKLRHPGGRQVIYLYCGSDASEAWHAIGHSGVPEVKSLLDMYLVGRLKTAKDGMLMACCQKSLPLFLSDGNATLNLPPGETKQTTTLWRWYTDAWHPVAMYLMEVENSVKLANLQFWDGQSTLTSAEPAKSEGHECSWDNISSYKRKKSVLQGQMLACTHRKVWQEFIPTILGDEFAKAIAPLNPDGARAHLTKLFNSESHSIAAALVDLLEKTTDDLIDATDDGCVSAPVQALFDVVAVMDETVFSSMKSAISRVVQCFEGFDITALNSEEENEYVRSLTSVVEQAVGDIVRALQTFCAASEDIARKVYSDNQIQDRIARLGSHEHSRGGLCRLITMNEPENKGEEKKE